MVEAAFAEDTALIDRFGGWPDEVRNSRAVAAIKHPVAFACRQAADVMLAQLGVLVGVEAAQAQFDTILAEQNATLEVQASLRKIERTHGKPGPSTLRSVH